MPQTLSGMFLVGGSNRPRKKKRTNGEKGRKRTKKGEKGRKDKEQKKDNKGTTKGLKRTKED